MGDKTDSERLASIVDYAKGLATFGSDELSQLATDILFMAGEKVAA